MKSGLAWLHVAQTQRGRTVEVYEKNMVSGEESIKHAGFWIMVTKSCEGAYVAWLSRIDWRLVQWNGAKVIRVCTDPLPDREMAVAAAKHAIDSREVS